MSEITETEETRIDVGDSDETSVDVDVSALLTQQMMAWK